MTSDKQIEANRKNALKSCGPKTQLGKETVCRNALKHGSRAETIEDLPKEKSAEFAQHVDAWVDEFAPATPSERYFIRHAATLSWKVERAERFEESMLAERVGDAVSACEGASDGQVEEAAARVMFDSSRQAEQLRRYLFAMHRDLRKDLETFENLRRQALTRNPKGPDAPNKANLGEATAVEKGDGHAEYREPVPVSAPNKPILDGTSAVEQGDEFAEILESLPASAPNKPIFACPVASNILISASELRSLSGRNRDKRRPDPARLLREIRARARSKDPAPEPRRGKPIQVTPETPLLS